MDINFTMITIGIGRARPDPPPNLQLGVVGRRHLLGCAKAAGGASLCQRTASSVAAAALMMRVIFTDTAMDVMGEGASNKTSAMYRRRISYSMIQYFIVGDVADLAMEGRRGGREARQQAPPHVPLGLRPRPPAAGRTEASRHTRCIRSAR